MPSPHETELASGLQIISTAEGAEGASHWAAGDTRLGETDVAMGGLRLSRQAGA